MKNKTTNRVSCGPNYGDTCYAVALMQKHKSSLKAELILCEMNITYSCDKKPSFISASSCMALLCINIVVERPF